MITFAFWKENFGSDVKWADGLVQGPARGNKHLKEGRGDGVKTGVCWRNTRGAHLTGSIATRGGAGASKKTGFGLTLPSPAWRPYSLLQPLSALLPVILPT